VGGSFRKIKRGSYTLALYFFLRAIGYASLSTFAAVPLAVRRGVGD